MQCLLPLYSFLASALEMCCLCQWSLVFFRRGECLFHVCHKNWCPKNQNRQHHWFPPHHHLHLRCQCLQSSLYLHQKCHLGQGGLSMMVLIEMVGGVGDKDGRGGTVGRMVTVAVDASAPGAGEEASLTLFTFLHWRGGFFWSCCSQMFMVKQEKLWWEEDLLHFYSKE